MNLHALESLQTMVRLLKDDLSGVVNILVPAVVDNHLNSKNHTVYLAASGALCELVLNLGEVPGGKLCGTWSSLTTALAFVVTHVFFPSSPLQTAASSCSSSAPRHGFLAAKQRWM